MTTDCSLNYKFNTWKFQAQTWGEHVVYRNCFWHSEQFLYTTCSPHVLQKEELQTKIYLYWISWRFLILCFCREILADEGKLPLKDLQEQFKDIYDEEIEEEQLKTDLNDLVELTEEEVQNIIIKMCIKSLQVMVRLHIFPIFPFLTKMLSFLRRKICKICWKSWYMLSY